MNANIIIPKKKNVWHPRKDLKDIKAMYSQSVIMEELRKKLDETPPHYIEMRCFSTDAKGNPTNKFSNVYQWGILEGWKNLDGEQLYVWEIMDKDGNFKYTSYGTRTKLGEVIAGTAVKTSGLTPNQI